MTVLIAEKNTIEDVRVSMNDVNETTRAQTLLSTLKVAIYFFVFAFLVSIKFNNLEIFNQVEWIIA